MTSNLALADVLPSSAGPHDSTAAALLDMASPAVLWFGGADTTCPGRLGPARTGPSPCLEGTSQWHRSPVTRVITQPADAGVAGGRFGW